MIAPMPDISVGDVIIAKNPWGIGPKDEETSDGRKFSFMRSQDIAAVVTGGIEEFNWEKSQFMSFRFEREWLDIVVVVLEPYRE